MRLYADNTLTVSGMRMTKIVFSLAAIAQYGEFTPSTGKLEPAQAAGDKTITWVGDATSVTFTVSHDAVFTDPAKRGQIRFTQVVIDTAK